MPAAVPAYLTDFSEAPPGHRFSLYYAGWNSNWSKPKSGVVDTLDKLKKLPEHSIKLLAAFCARQNAAAEILGEQVLALPCISTAPFATGLGNEHPLENGFAFLTPYGLPYLAGSGIKGVIRTAAEELASGEWGEAHGWDEESIRALFGPGEEDPTRDTQPQQGALRFWDVLPILHKNEMSVEIMTPHHGEYYQQGKHGPHNSESPIPIPFLAVPARSKFTFFVECNAALLRDDTLRLTWRSLLEAAFEHAGKWLGFGAKTAVGYGRMKLDEKAIEEAREKKDAAKKKAREETEQRQRKEDMDAMPPFERSIQEVLNTRPKEQSELTALFNAFKSGKWQGDEKREIATRLQSLMKESKQWREKSDKKKPEKDEPFQMTIAVLAALRGQV
ncbi:MAG: type III-B CRISPR module RAMP protein Cmr6 [Comamonadaceae bacterium CG12_big_fil_rev_8_21_14_0_65_59_15]|nr:MAG: type III-B CRISPR module RAMP protein Cmr6 [Comamonadaceae bacterium CG12_big_fil_rev_8_21_14_0_65_59_15]PIY00993.1 MAG: type III-B CRISPR module RAMP protein Cmr6 [Hydrogenophilales bacterium CG_4_10_14_3_um_filter_58_23]PJB06306.1 MAG: type III-B CRISPR module RAMP protein Cmr6 [Hydrogenophilales bacterium CG_4_9_14_3_um_filter_59_35]